jgi:hypothetical protein
MPVIMTTLEHFSRSPVSFEMGRAERKKERQAGRRSNSLSSESPGMTAVAQIALHNIALAVALQDLRKLEHRRERR